MDDRKRKKTELIAEVRALRSRLSSLETALPSDLSVERGSLGPESDPGWLSSLLESLHALVYRASAATHELAFVSGSVVEVTGRSVDELLGGITWDTVVHPADRTRVVSERGLLEGGCVPSFVSAYRLLRPDGTVRWVRDVGRPARGCSGNIDAVEGLVVDVTVERETQEELRRTRDLLLRAEILAGIGSWSWDANAGKVSWSPGMYRHYGRSPGEVDSPLELARSSIHPEDLARLSAHMERARESGRLEPIEYRVRVADDLRYHRTEGEIFRDPETGSERMVGFVQDVTALKQAEEERRRAEQERDRLFEISVDLLSVTGFDGRFKQVNPAWTRALGWTTEELLATPWLELVHPDDVEPTKEATERLRRGESLTGFANRCRHREGSYRWFSWNARPSTDADLVVSVARDVTEEKAAREALEREVDFRNSIVKRAAEGLAVFHEIGSYPFVAFTVWNDRMREITGYTMEEINRSGWYQTVYPDPEEQELARQRLARMTEGRDLYGEERVIRRKGGAKGVLRISTSVLRAPDERVHVLCLMEDVTERRRAEEALRESEARLVAAFDNVPFGFWVSDAQGRYVFQNRTSLDLWGNRTGRSVEDVELEPSELASSLEKNRRALAGEVVEGVVEQARAGEVRVFHELLAPVRRDGVVSGLVGVNIDITQERRALQAMKESEERYRSLFEGAPYGIYRSTPDGRFLSVNRALAAMLGFDSGEELQQRNVRELYQDPREWNRLLEEYRQEPRIQGLDVVWKRRDGTPITVRLSGRPLRSEDGDPRGFEMIAEDVTERRLLEEQFRQAQKMEAVGRLAGGIAHDFNNLLTAVTGYADLLRARIPLDDLRRGYVEEIGGAADRAAALTRQLLAFSRRQLLQPRVVKLEEIVLNVERMLGRIIGEDVDLATRLEAGGHVKADPGQLEQVLLNLAVNARDAMPEGGRLLIETRDVDATASMVQKRAPMPPGAYVRLSVSDTGIGMDRHALAHIFEPFFTTKEPGKGTGLGLATVYGVVKQSGGYIWVTSEPGRGARFEIYLPRVEGEGEARAKAAPPELAGGSETILLVEDEEGVRRIVSEMLEWYGYTVLRARGASEALAIAQSHRGPIHLLLTDVVMPRLGGRALREQLVPYRPRIPVLYISGYAGESRTEELLEDGAAFLSKPFTAGALAQKVREVLGGSPGS